jgi:GNAT superfamily N-acetyltransferase
MSATDTYAFRDANNTDCEPVWSLISGVLSDYAIATDLATTDEDLSDIEGNYRDAGGAFFVLMDAQTIIGTVALCRDSESTCELCRMYLAPQYRRRGLGRALLNQAIQEAKRRGFKEMRLATARVLVEAIALYESFGFTICEGTPVGKNCNLLMRKILE